MLFLRTIKKVNAIGLELKENLVMMKRVCKVTKGRRYFSFSSIVVKGNKNGIVGYGFGKAKEASDSIQKAGEYAKKNLFKIPIKHGTIPHEQFARFSGSKIFMKPASNGTGILSGGPMRAVLELVGISNILSKSIGSSNPHNVVRATMIALLSLRSVNYVCKQRGFSIKNFFNR